MRVAHLRGLHVWRLAYQREEAGKRGVTQGLPGEPACFPQGCFRSSCRNSASRASRFRTSYRTYGSPLLLQCGSTTSWFVRRRPAPGHFAHVPLRCPAAKSLIATTRATANCRCFPQGIVRTHRSHIGCSSRCLGIGCVGSVLRLRQYTMIGGVGLLKLHNCIGPERITMWDSWTCLGALAGRMHESVNDTCA